MAAVKKNITKELTSNSTSLLAHNSRGQEPELSITDVNRPGLPLETIGKGLLLALFSFWWLLEFLGFWSLPTSTYHFLLCLHVVRFPSAFFLHGYI